MLKVFKVGTVWTAVAKIKYIDDSGDTLKWVTIATCIDTPKHIGDAIAKAKQKSKGKTLWVKSLMFDGLASDFCKTSA